MTKGNDSFQPGDVTVYGESFYYKTELEEIVFKPETKQYKLRKREDIYSFEKLITDIFRE